MNLSKISQEAGGGGGASSAPSSKLTSRSQSTQSVCPHGEVCDDTVCTDHNAIANQDDKQFLPAIATMSLGDPRAHPLPLKLHAANDWGFEAIEIFWDDMKALAVSELGLSNPESPWKSEEDAEKMVATAATVAQMCQQLGLAILSLQPFRNYDGILDEKIHDERIEEFKVWLLVAQVLGAQAIGVPSTIGADPNGPAYTGDTDVLAKDLCELSDLARPYGVRIAYENLCFARHTQSWSQAWDVISRTNRLGEVGFLPDTFNLCGDAYADPSRPNGLQDDGQEKLEASLNQLCATIPVANIPYLQVADAEFMDPAIKEDHPWMADCTNPKMAWSRNARLFACEEKGYLPVILVVQYLVAAGWSGWVSLEVFSRTTKVEGEATIHEHAERAWRSWEKLAAAMKWPIRPVSRTPACKSKLKKQETDAHELEGIVD